MAANAFEAIRKAYPDSVKYETNYNRLQKELQALDARTAEKIARSGIEYFIVYHPALTYYDGVRRIFYQNQFPASTVEVIARDIDAEYVAIDPLDRDAIANIDTITDLITAK